MVALSFKLIVLMYHSLYYPEADCSYVENEDPIYILDLEKFESHIEHLSSAGIPVVNPGKLEKLGGQDSLLGRERAILLTFDDGHVSNYELALPILDKANFKAVFFITVDWIGKDGYLKEDMIRDLQERGMVLGSHGKTHRFFTEMDASELKKELIVSKQELEEITGHEVNSLSIPGGRINRLVCELALEAGYSTIFTSKPVINLVPNINSMSEYGRFPITRGLSFYDFQRIVRGEPCLSYRIRMHLPSVLRKVLRERAYSKVRSFTTSTMFSSNK